MSSGDGWVSCAAGHRHWGRYGAAGLLLHDAGRVILQHRAPWTHEGDSWGMPGGARHSDEDPISAAVREAGEEAGLARADIDPIGLYIDDHGGWSYATVVARATRPLQPVTADAESVTVTWQPVDQVAGLRLHSGFAAAWHQLRQLPPVLYLVLTAELAGDPRLAALVRHGIAAARLPADIVRTGLHRMYPHPVIADSADELASTADRKAGQGQLLLARDGAALAALTDL
ncbi:MAG: NUDIX domain-containing protein [Jatrophihabitantaceae bacterium]